MPSIRDATLVVKELASVVKAHVSAAFAPLAERVKALEDRTPERGEKGDPGRDAEPVDVSAVVDAVVARLLVSERMETLADLAVVNALAEYLKENPVQHGRDGADGRAGDKGEKGDPGEAGKDGAGVSDLLIDRDGNLVASMTDGRMKALGTVVGADGKPGRDGVDGKDGLSFEHATGSFDAERGFVLTLTNGQRSAEFVLPYMRHGGFWSEGKAVKAGESWTTDGALWIAKRDTNAKPCIEHKEDWILAARKGRDGKDGRNGIDKTAPVTVNHDA
jgi:hypothetical protein